MSYVCEAPFCGIELDRRAPFRPYLTGYTVGRLLRLSEEHPSSVTRSYYVYTCWADPCRFWARLRAEELSDRHAWQEHQLRMRDIGPRAPAWHLWMRAMHGWPETTERRRQVAGALAAKARGEAAVERYLEAQALDPRSLPSL